MLLKYIEPQHRGGPMTVILGDTWDLRLWKKQHDARLGVKELQFYLASGAVSTRQSLLDALHRLG
jgi:hypothetical protein